MNVLRVDDSCATTLEAGIAGTGSLPVRVCRHWVRF
jgi:hypothetical protein